MVRMTAEAIQQEAEKIAPETWRTRDPSGTLAEQLRRVAQSPDLVPWERVALERLADLADVLQQEPDS